MIHSSYLKEVMDMQQLPRIITKLAATIRAKNLVYDAIAFRGMSGALVAPMLCRRLKKGLIVCRKESEKSHGNPVEGYLIGGNYIIVDDFIGCGDTIKGIVAAISKWHSIKTNSTCIKIPSFKPVAVVLYKREDGAMRPSIEIDDDFTIPVYGMKQ